jgi:hypothetical protein
MFSNSRRRCASRGACLFKHRTCFDTYVAELLQLGVLLQSWGSPNCDRRSGEGSRVGNSVLDSRTSLETACGTQTTSGKGPGAGNTEIRYVRYDQLTHGLQKRASAMAIIALSLAMFVAFWSRNAWPIYRSGDRDPFGFGHARLSVSRSFDQQRPKGWLQWTSDEGNDGRGHVQAYPREPERRDGDVDIEQ